MNILLNPIKAIEASLTPLTSHCQGESHLGCGPTSHKITFGGGKKDSFWDLYTEPEAFDLRFSGPRFDQPHSLQVLA